MGNGNGAKRDGLTGHIEELKVLERFLEKGPGTDHFGAAEGKRIEYEERIIATALGVYMAGDGVKALSQSIAAVSIAPP